MAIEQILVTGSSGTIGTALVERLLDEGYVVFGTDIEPNPWVPAVDERTQIADLRNPEEVSELPTDVDLVVHLGAHARVHQLVNDPERMMENLDMTFNVLEHARRSGIPNFLFASSREVYGDASQTVFAESETAIEKTKSPYTASKVGGESMVQAYGECYDFSTCITRFSNVYGKYDGSNRVVPLFIAQSNQGRPLTVYGSEKILDFTYIDDCVEGLVRIIDQFHKATDSVLNVASGRGTSLVELAREIDARTPGDSEINVEPSRRGEVNKYISDISKAEKLVGYSPNYSLAEGLDRTTDWYLDRPSLLEQIVPNSADTE